MIKDWRLTLVSITKNPYSWLLSLHQRPYHQYYEEKPDFETFLATPWKPVFRDNVTSSGLNPIVVWNLKNRSYLNLLPLNGQTITAESIFSDPDAVVHQLADHFGLKWQGSGFRDFEQSTKENDKDTHYYRDYYLNNRWREKLSDSAVDVINRYLDKKLVAHYGY